MSEPDRERGVASFEQFRDSFFYGSRTNLNFKFLEHLSDGEAADFLEGLLEAVVRSYDGEDWTPVLEHVREWQARGYAGATEWTYEQGPVARLERPLSETTVGLVASTGHFVEGEDPEPFGAEGMTQEEAIASVEEFLRAPPVLSEIPLDTPREKLRARHPGYDVEGVRADPNVALPLDRMRELAEEGHIAAAYPLAWSFVGACAQLPLVRRTGPEWVRGWTEEGFGAAVLVPV